RYPSRGFVTANEVRVPIGQPIELRLSSSDVIHSFWVPQVMGKHDMTPGHVNTTWLQVDKPGVYWGECTEFCGLQHAKMAFVLVAQTQSEFDAWAAGQQRPAAESIDPQVLRGAQVFARDGCIRCHTVRQGGAAVGGDLGPDLTHVASRLTLGAGILANNRGNLAGWTANPQALKPGNYMPVTYLDAESLLAVVAYLESLK
ncbi:MAG: c-type cytochrome, partial [Chloroflexota bacterium]